MKTILPLQRIWTLITLSAGAIGCSASSTMSCGADTIEARFVGSSTVGGVRTNVTFLERQTTQTIQSQAFLFLSDVLGHGLATGPRSAVWSMQGQGSTDGVLLIQLGGQRSIGGTLPLLGALTTGLPWGEGPPLSAVFSNGLFVLFSLGSFQATQANGTLSLQSVAPLRGVLQATLSASGVILELEGQLSVQLSGPGC
jgi:hypothetical protein